jgi:epoxyqueuosine reductase
MARAVRDWRSRCAIDAAAYSMTSVERTISDAAHREGFALVGFAPLRRIEEREEYFRRWVADGRPGEMAWLARAPERRFDARTLDSRLRSVISLAYPYAAPAPRRSDWRAELRGRIAAYALGPDYHDTVLAKARAVAAALAAERPGIVTRVYVDTGPVFEREWAAEARLGWFGRNTNLLNRYHGSYFFLAEVFTNLDLPGSAEPYRDHCGTCRRCLDLCPTHALTDGYLLEPRICISYLTIELRTSIARELRSRLGNWVFGCDICQEVCPWNDDATRAATDSDELMPSLEMLMALDDAGFSHRYGRTAVRRAKRRGLLRNAAVALGNSRNPAAIAILARCLATEAEALVRSHAAWALGRLGGRASQQSLERARTREQDAGVLEEIEIALATMIA